MNKTLGLTIAFVAVAGIAFATALTAPRNTAQKADTTINIGVKTNAVIYAGGMVSVDSTGYAIPAGDTTNTVVIGRAAQSVDATGVASGTLKINVDRGVFFYAADSGTKTKFKIGSTAYVVDDQTVSATNSGTYAIQAGVIVDYDPIAGQVAVRLGK